jgi:hypothetical protein
MTKITDSTKLETLAQAATEGTWEFLGMTATRDPEIRASNGSRVANLAQADMTKQNAAFVAAANPATILAIVRDLAAKDAIIKDLEHKIWCLGVNLDGAKEHLAELQGAPQMPEPCIYEGDDSPMHDEAKGCDLEQVRDYGRACLKYGAALARTSMLNVDPDDTTRLNWIQEQSATVGRLFDNSAFLVSVDKRAIRTDKSVRAAIDFAKAKIGFSPVGSSTVSEQAS